MGLIDMPFNPQSLYDAIDAQRRERGITWSEVAKGICVSVSTIKGMTKRKWGIELDGVMGMTRWLGRTVENFAGRDGGPAPEFGVLTKTGSYIRFDTTLLYVAVDAERQRRGITWEQVAAAVWPNGQWGAKQLKGLANGGRGNVYAALAIWAWLGRTIQSFTRRTLY
jgi:hypothetical protein